MRYSQKQLQEFRNIPLSQILCCLGAKRDLYDKAKWHTSKGVISITGCKYFNWFENKGGGGAIDLVMHLESIGFRQALQWLQNNCTQSSHNLPTSLKAAGDKKQFVLPERNDANIEKLMLYLHCQRAIPEPMVYRLMESGCLYSDNRKNAVFLLLGRGKRVVGAELVGTTCRWRGMAPGSRKNLGGFHISVGKPDHIILTESAVDAISYCALHQDCTAISTAGLNVIPAWLPEIINQGIEVFCGFDADEAGDYMARKMKERYPLIQRKRPPLKDWNEVLKNISPLL